MRSSPRFSCSNECLRLVLKRRNGNVANRRKFTSRSTSRRVNDIITDENIKAEILWKFVWRNDIRREGRGELQL